MPMIKIGYAGNEVGYVDLGKAFEVSDIVKDLGIRQSDYMDMEYFPQASIDTEVQIMYFAAMVAIDHRLSIPGKPYETVIEGKRYSGSDMLWRLGVEKLNSDQSFFTPARLAKVTPDDVKNWLGDVWDYGIRAFLLSDLGLKIMVWFNGSILGLIKRTGGRLAGKDGFVESMKTFTAYSDPVEKKIFLLAKFLHGRGLVKFTDLENAHVAVDNHLTRIALRLGLVELNEKYEGMVKGQIPFTPQEDINLRLLVRDSWKHVSIASGVDAFALDDYLWNFGRTICLRDSPKCETCPFKKICSAYRSGVFLTEHSFYATYWY